MGAAGRRELLCYPANPGRPGDEPECQCHETDPQPHHRSHVLPRRHRTDLAGEVVTNFIEGQKLLLALAQREHEIVTTGVKERVAGTGRCRDD